MTNDNEKYYPYIILKDENKTNNKIAYKYTIRTDDIKASEQIKFILLDDHETKKYNNYKVEKNKQNFVKDMILKRIFPLDSSTKDSLDKIIERTKETELIRSENRKKLEKNLKETTLERNQAFKTENVENAENAENAENVTNQINHNFKNAENAANQINHNFKNAKNAANQINYNLKNASQTNKLANILKHNTQSPDNNASKSTNVNANTNIVIHPEYDDYVSIYTMNNDALQMNNYVHLTHELKTTIVKYKFHELNDVNIVQLNDAAHVFLFERITNNNIVSCDNCALNETQQHKMYYDKLYYIDNINEFNELMSHFSNK